MTMTETTRDSALQDRRELSQHLTGPEKAAILFLCLGERRGTELMRKLDERDIHAITRAMSGLGLVRSEVVEEVMLEFSEHMYDGGGVVGSFTIAEKMLQGFMPPDQVSEIMNEISGPRRERGMWDRFSALNETVIANYLKGEHDQTAAAILSNVKPDVAARVLPLLGPEMMQNVVERMMSMDAVPGHMMRQIEDALQQDIMASASQPSSSRVEQRMAELFNKLDREAYESLAPELEQRLPEVFGAIKQNMFTFDDLLRLDLQSLAQVMRGMEGNLLPLALRGVSKEGREYFLSALPSRSRDMLLEEMSTMGPVRGREVREAQSAMVDYAKELADQDQIRLPTDEDDDEVFE